MTARVRVFSTDYCPYCDRAKALLLSRGIPFDEVDVSRDSAKRSWLVGITGRRTVPQIFIDDVPIGGSDELHALDRRGALRELASAARLASTRPQD